MHLGSSQSGIWESSSQPSVNDIEAIPATVAPDLTIHSALSMQSIDAFQEEMHPYFEELHL